MIAIIGWLTNIARAIGYWCKAILTEAIKFSTTLWGVILIVAGLVYTAFVDAVGAINTLVNALTGAQPWSGSLAHGSGTVGWLLSVANTFTPLDEAFSYGAVYLILMGAFGLYHLIKSWIPTIGGG